ncbi:hypothetical protein X971_2179 [Agrobacterium tumefaciens LBA4213 (Ach5)]|nr:hypothetical protein X971_2179 [Agrobacterium tumefaciens LBA4213 (Ach5)]
MPTPRLTRPREKTHRDEASQHADEDRCCGVSEVMIDGKALENFKHCHLRNWNSRQPYHLPSLQPVYMNG